MRRRHFLLALLLAAAVYLPGQSADEFKFPLKPDSVRFAAIGDMGTGSLPQNDVAQRMVDARRAFPFEFVILLGDNIYGRHNPRDYERKFAQPYKPLLDAGVKFYAALGNHDSPLERFYKLFNMNGERYHTFKYGNVRFFALDSNYMDPQQLDWIKTQLEKARDSDWKICFFHHPLYSSGRSHGPTTDLRSLLEPLFIKHGVDVVFSGHEHSYERILPQNGIYYFVEGASGQLKTGNVRPSEITAKSYDADRSFLLVEIAGDELYFQAISRAGQTMDSGSFRRPR